MAVRTRPARPHRTATEAFADVHPNNELEQEKQMTTTVKQAFDKFASNLEITDRQAELVSKRRKNVVDAIKESLTLYEGHESYVIGSWDRRTMTRYLREADVDVMVILHYGENKGWDNSDGTIKALDRFRTILDSAYPNTP